MNYDSRFRIDLPADIIRRARRRDPAALEIIYLRFRKPVYGLALRIHRDVGIAQDIVQDTFVALIRNIHRNRDGGPFWAWVRTIAVNRAIDVLRQRERRGQVEDGSVSNEGSCRSTTHVLDIDAALAGLSESARAVVWLHEVEGFTHREIGQAMGKSESFSKSTLARALGQLAERYGASPSHHRKTSSCT